jgi:hypothetical protein
MPSTSSSTSPVAAVEQDADGGGGGGGGGYEMLRKTTAGKGRCEIQEVLYMTGRWRLERQSR